MKIFIIAALLMIASTQTVEDCVRENCPDQVRACELNAFCAAAAIKCYNGCGSDMANIQCIADCAKVSDNQRLKNLYDCGIQSCEISQYWNYAKGCDVNGCAQKLKNECFESLEQSFQCAFRFFDRHTECECVRELF